MGTALHRAVESQDPERVHCLLRRGANRHIKGREGLTPLELTEVQGWSEVANVLRND